MPKRRFSRFLKVKTYMLKLFRNDRRIVSSVKISSEAPVNLGFAPKKLRFLLSECYVEGGAHVLVGDLLGITPESRIVASGVSGTVTEITEYPEGLFSLTVENDDLGSVCPDDLPFGDRNAINVTDLTPEILVSEIERSLVSTRLSGISLTDRTLSQRIKEADGKAKQIVISALSCDPYDSSYERLVEECSEDILAGMKILMASLKIGEGVIVVDTENKRRPEGLASLIKPTDNIKVVFADVRYPSDNEHTILHALTSVELSRKRNAERLACVVFDVKEIIAIARAFLSGSKETGETVTVVGTDVGFSFNVYLPYGTELSEIAELCSAELSDDVTVSVSGILRGRSVSASETFAPGMGPIVFLENKKIPKFNGTRCLRCGRCASVCPMFLLPSYIYLACSLKSKQMAEKFDMPSCIECGACQYVCDGEIPLLSYIRDFKNAGTEDDSDE